MPKVPSPCEVLYVATDRDSLTPDWGISIIEARLTREHGCRAGSQLRTRRPTWA